MNIRPIKDEESYNLALERIEELWGASEGSPEGDKLDVIVMLVDAYEAKHHSIDAPDPIEAIKFRMEQLGLARKDLEPFLGTRGRVSEIMNRKRPLSLNMIKNLHRGLQIPLECLFNDETNDLAHTR